MKVRIAYKPGADEPFAGAVSVIEGTSFPSGGATVRFGRSEEAGAWCLGAVEANEGGWRLRPLALVREAAGADEYLEWVESQIASVEVEGIKLTTAHRHVNAPRSFSWEQLGLVDMGKWPADKDKRQDTESNERE